MKKLIQLFPFLLLLFLYTFPASAQSDEVITKPAPDMKDICEFDPTDINSFHYIRHQDIVGKSASSVPSSVINVTYDGDWPSEAIEAFEFAAGIWETHLQSSVPIEVNAMWEELEGNVLGSAGPTLISTVPESAGGEPETWYAIAQASAMTGVDQKLGSDAEFDVNVRMNAAFDDWYYGTDGETPQGLIDFVTVVLHELGHGIGFIGSVQGDEDQQVAGWGFGETDERPAWPIIYDLPVVDGDGEQLVENESVYPNPSSSLYQAATGQRDGVFFTGDMANQANLGLDVELFAPNPWQPGSSYSHVDLETFTNTENELMRPQINRANAVHSPGPIFCGMLDDWGWPLGANCLELIGVEARIVVEQTDLDFGISNVGSTREMTVTVRNREDSEDPLRGRIELDSDNFNVIGGGRSYSIEPGRSEDFTIRYSPGDADMHEADFVITHNADNEGSPITVELIGEALEENRIVALEQSFPNPINPSQNTLRIPYALAVDENVRVTLDLYSTTGQHVGRIFDGERGEGRYEDEYNARELASGVYLYRIIVDGVVETKKMTIVR